MNFYDHTLEARQLQVVGILEAVCESLEPTTSQTALAKERYEGVGGWLAKSNDPVLRSIIVYLQGSTALGTVVRPIGFNEFDVDLVMHHSRSRCPAIAGSARRKPSAIVSVQTATMPPLDRGDAALLASQLCRRVPHGHHALDPPIRTVASVANWFPTGRSRRWKPSDRKAIVRLYSTSVRSSCLSSVSGKRIVAGQHAVRMWSLVRSRLALKGILRRIVQIAKRHRDVSFSERVDVAPLSVIITTLAFPQLRSSA